jgi:hypothetical protein
MFSLKPGISLFAMNFACYIALIIVMIAILAISTGLMAVGSKAGGSPSTMIFGSVFMIAVMFIASFAVYFAVADALMPMLCRWVGRSKHKSHAKEIAKMAVGLPPVGM